MLPLFIILMIFTLLMLLRVRKDIFLLEKKLERVTYYNNRKKLFKTMDSVGKDLNDICEISKHYREKIFVGIVASVFCSHCYDEMEEFIKTKNEQDLLFESVCILVSGNSLETKKKFRDEFEKAIEIWEISVEDLKKMEIDVVPSYILVDAKGIVIEQKISLQAIKLKWTELSSAIA